MKTIAILMVIALIAAVGGVGYLYMTTGVTIQGLGVSAVEAAAQPDTFYALARQLESGSLIGTPFVSGSVSGAENYQFLTYTIRLRNNSFLPADMVEVQITPMAGDVLQVGDIGAKMLPANATGDISATILTDINMHSVREIVVTYYIWGFPFSAKATSHN